MTRTLPLALLLLTVTATGQSSRAAEEYTDTIPADLARLLLDFTGRGDFAVYDGIMDEFPDFRLPAGFEVVGSLRQTGSLRLALRTGLDEETAVARIADEFTGNGWITLPDMEPFGRDTGFVSPDDPLRALRRSRQLCDDDQGTVSVSYFRREDGAHVMLSANDRRGVFGMDPRTCAEQVEQIEQSMSMRSMRGGMGLAQYMPRLELPVPDDSDRYSPFRIGGMSGSNQEMETDAVIEIDWEMAALYEHLAEQIATQDWALDSESVGEVSATGTWIDTTAGPGTLIGTLSIVSGGDNRYDLKFVIRAQGRQGGGAFIRGSN